MHAFLIVAALVTTAGEYEPCSAATDCPSGDECVRDVGSTVNACRLPCDAATQCPAADPGVGACKTEDSHCFISCGTDSACPTSFVCNPSVGACAFVGTEGEGEGAGTACTCDGDCDAATPSCLGGECLAACASDAIACPAGAVCVIGVGTGACAVATVTHLPDGAVCQNNGDCTSGRCALAFSAGGHSICAVNCTTTADCSGGLVCGADGLCVRDGACPVPAGRDGGGTDTASSCAAGPRPALLAVGLALLAVRRRRRAR